MIRTEVIKINPDNPEESKIRIATAVLRDDGLVAFPTETVYGLGANFLSQRAISRLYEVKNRPVSKPFSIHIAEKSAVEELATGITPVAYRLMDKFWPGPLTLILKSKDHGKIGLRMPDNKVALALIRYARLPIVAPSANLSGNPAPQFAEEVLKDFNGLIDVILDAGKTHLGIESTVLDMTCANPEVLREGATPFSEIEKILKGRRVLFVCTGNSCRSVMAKALLEKKLSHRKDVEVQAVGVGAIPGMGATKETIELLAKEGMDVSGHRAQRLTDEFVKRSDLILVMEKFQEDEVLKRVPDAKGRIYLLGEFCPRANHIEIPDPIAKPIGVYIEVFNLIKECVDRMSNLI